MTTKIIHLSDLHFGKEKKLETRFDLITQDIINKMKPAYQYTIIITGDLVHIPSSDNFNRVKHYLNRLKRAGYQLLAVPGNHDVIKYLIPREKYLKRFHKKFLENKYQSYPKVDYSSDGEIIFIGLNSLMGEMNFDFNGADGTLTQKQLNRLDEILNKSERDKIKYKVVYLHHHPFESSDSHGLKDKNELGRILIKYNVSALLYGHRHKGKAGSQWGIKRCYDAGTTTCYARSEKDSTYHRVIDLSKEPGDDFTNDDYCFAYVNCGPCNQNI